MGEAGRSPWNELGISGGEWARILVLYGLIATATVVAFALTLSLGKLYPLLGAWGVLAFVLGLRHGVDVDHIAAIDNTTRKLLQEGKRPLTVGTWFSLGHSTVVVGLMVAIVVTYGALTTLLPALQSVGGIVGTLVSGAFLWIIGIVNVVIVVEIYLIFRRVRAGELDPGDLEDQLSKRGFLNRYFGRFFRVVEKPWQIYPIGLLFGLGFDTESQVAVLGLGPLGISSHIPLVDLLLLPVMFTCGMVAVDTTDAVAMRVAYGWAFWHPVRKIYYNLTFTVISVLVAFVIGGVELLAVLSTELGLSGGVWAFFYTLNSGSSFEYLGYAIIGLFLVCWLVAMGLYRLQGYERTSFVRPPPAILPSTEPEAA